MQKLSSWCRLERMKHRNTFTFSKIIVLTSINESVSVVTCDHMRYSSSEMSFGDNTYSLCSWISCDGHVDCFSDRGRKSEIFSLRWRYVFPLKKPPLADYLTAASSAPGLFAFFCSLLKILVLWSPSPSVFFTPTFFFISLISYHNHLPSSGISITSGASCPGPSRWTAALSSSTRFSSRHSQTSREKEVRLFSLFSQITDIYCTCC